MVIVVRLFFVLLCVGLVYLHSWRWARRKEQANMDILYIQARLTESQRVAGMWFATYVYTYDDTEYYHVHKSRSAPRPTIRLYININDIDIEASETMPKPGTKVYPNAIRNALIALAIMFIPALFGGWWLVYVLATGVWAIVYSIVIALKNHIGGIGLTFARFAGLSVLGFILMGCTMGWLEARVDPFAYDYVRYELSELENYNRQLKYIDELSAEEICDLYYNYNYSRSRIIEARHSEMNPFTHDITNKHMAAAELPEWPEAYDRWLDYEYRQERLAESK